MCVCVCGGGGWGGGCICLLEGGIFRELTALIFAPYIKPWMSKRQWLISSNSTNIGTRPKVFIEMTLSWIFMLRQKIDILEIISCYDSVMTTNYNRENGSQKSTNFDSEPKTASLYSTGEGLKHEHSNTYNNVRLHGSWFMLQPSHNKWRTLRRLFNKRSGKPLYQDSVCKGNYQ